MDRVKKDVKVSDLERVEGERGLVYLIFCFFWFGSSCSSSSLILWKKK